jgi:branched-subunit amino acid transport protein AzlD
VLVGFLPNEIWRALGLVMASGLNEKSEIVMWARAVATAILAGVIAKLILFPSGELTSIPLAVRVFAAMCGFAAFLAVRRPPSAARCLPAWRSPRSCAGGRLSLLRV